MKVIIATELLLSQASSDIDKKFITFDFTQLFTSCPPSMVGLSNSSPELLVMTAQLLGRY